MATRKTTTSTAAKKPTMSAVKKQNQKLKEQYKKVIDGAYCYRCGQFKGLDHFYVDTDPKIHNQKKGNGLNAARICKECCEEISERVDSQGNHHEPTKDSVKETLKYLNKPFLESVWNAAIDETNNILSGSQRSNVWRSYIHIIQMKNYINLTWDDSDMFKDKEFHKYDDEKTEKELVEEHAGQDTYDAFLKNKSDVVRLLGYDPFEEEKVGDQPFLYSQLLGLLDSSEDTNDDMMRVSSAISIVRNFLQIQKLDDAVTKLMADVDHLSDNAAAIRSLQDSKQKITSMTTKLAEESCLSLAHSRSNSKASVTWTGKVAKIRELNLRGSEVNGFDINTCRGFQQVEDIQQAAIMKQLNLDDSEWSDMVADMRETNDKLRKEKDSYAEINRILLKENLDLKDTLEEKGIKLDKEMKPLKDIYSIFRDEEEGIEFTGEETEGQTDELDNSSV